MKDINVYGIKNRINKNHLYLFSPCCELFDIQRLDDDGERHRCIKMITTVEKAKRRFQILGYDMKRAKEYFNDAMQYFKNKYNEEDEDLYLETKEYYNNIGFEKYISALKLVFEAGIIDIYNKDILLKYPDLENNFICKCILKKLSERFYLGHIFYEDIEEDEEDMINERMDLFICLQCLQDDDTILLDLTDVIDSGWVDVQKIENFYKKEIDKTILITEGKNDIGILEGSISVLFPEYKHLFTFFDFNNYRADGGASYLVKLLKSFSAAQIKNRIIALFDNDSAAVNELLQIEKIQLLDTITILKLPRLEYCMSYPTIGPSGNSNMDINENAVSIEMFYGDDILKSKGEYLPVTWNGYIDRVKKYQGSISDKDRINELMKEKLNNPDIEQQDWSKLKLLWEYIFNSN